MLSLFAGSDAVATTLVVASFLSGLGIGSFVSLFFADQLAPRRALRTFAFCELGIAVCGVASRFVFAEAGFAHLAGLAPHPAVLHVGLFALLLPPTVLMGLSLPLLARAAVRAIDAAPRTIGRLYGLNTLGASCGALVAGFYLIGTYGFVPTLYLAASLNIGVGLAGACIARRRPDSRTENASAPERRDLARPSTQIWFWSASVFIGGFVVVSLEILWFRVLGLTMQSNTYAFPAILTVLLLGDAAGLVYASRAPHRMREPARLFLLLLAGALGWAILALAALWIASGPYDLSRLANGSFASHGTAEKLGYFLFCAGFTVACVLPPAFLLGMSFPVTQRALQDDLGCLARRVAVVQFSNILGNALGALVTGLVLLDKLGTAGSLRLLAGLGIGLVALSMGDASRHDWSRPAKLIARRRAAVGLAILLLGSAIAFPGSEEFWARLHGAAATDATITAEDMTGVAVLRHIAGEDLHYGEPAQEADLLYIAGHSQSRIPFLTIHGALGAIGPLLHPDPRKILIIGDGTGGTAYAAGIKESTERIRVIEIIQPVFAVMRAHGAAGRNSALARLLADPRYEDVVGDARHVLLTDTTRYDVIESDAIYPYTANAGMLYSVEFFEQVKARLNPGGLYVQWVPTERVLASFLTVFPYVLRLHNVVLGSDQPIRYSRDGLATALAGSGRDDRMASAWDVQAILDWLTAAPEQSWGPHDPRTDDDLNTDLFPKDEYFLNGRRRTLF